MMRGTLRLASVCGVAASLMSGSAFASECTVEGYVGTLVAEAAHRSADIAANQLPLIEEVEQLSTKAKDPKRPVGEQLGMEDLDRFATLTNRIKVIHLSMHLEEMRKRDMKVLGDLFRIATELYAGGPPPQNGDPDFFYFGLLVFMRESFPDTEITTPTALSPCTWNNVMAMEEHAAVQRLNAGQSLVLEQTQILEAWKAKYGAPLNPEKMNAADRRAFEAIKQTLMQLQAVQWYITDIEHIKAMAGAEEVLQASYRQDILDYGGDVDSLGKSFDRSGHDERTKTLGKLWVMVSQQVPSDDILMFRELQE